MAVSTMLIERSSSTNSSAHLTIEQAQQYIDDLDFSMIIKKMVAQQGWQKGNAIQLSQLYKNFLFLNFKYYYIPKVSKKQFLYPLLYLSNKLIKMLGFWQTDSLKNTVDYVR